MSFAQFLSILLARWRWFVSIFMGTILLALLLSLVLPKRYTATATVVLDAKPDPVAALTAMYNSASLMPSYLATQADILASDRVARRVVRNLRMADPTRVRLQWQEDTGGVGSIDSWLADILERNLKVKPGRESNLISVSYDDPSPERAATMANAFVQAYMDVILEMKTRPAKEYSSFFNDQAKQYREVLLSAQKKLTDFENEKGLTSSDERWDVENSRLNDLSQQLVAIQTLSSESANRQIQARSAADRMQDVLNSPLIASLKQDLSRAQAQLTQMSATLGDNNPQIIAQKSQIEEIRSRIGAETARITGGVTVSNKINQAREADLKAALEAQRAKVLALKADRDHLAILMNDVDNAQKAYDALIARLNQSSLESADRLPNVNILTTADTPTKPSSPRVVLNLFIAFFVGLLLAIIVTLLIEHFDRRVRIIDDINLYLGEPVVGVLPSPDAGPGLFKKEPITLLQQRLLRHAKA